MDMDQIDDKLTEESLDLLENLCQDFLCETFTIKDLREVYVSNKEVPVSWNPTAEEYLTKHVTDYDFRQKHLDRLVEIGALNHDPKTKAYELNMECPNVLDYIA